MLCTETLSQMKPFDMLPESRLAWICDRAEHIHLTHGEVLVREGDTSLGFFIQTTGQITVSRRSNGTDMPVGRHESPSFFGEIQVLTEDLVPVTLTADTDTDPYRLNCPDFLDLIHSCRDFEKDIFKLMNNAVFGKTMENVRNRIDFRLTADENKGKWIKNPRFKCTKDFNKHLSGFMMNKASVTLNKPIYVGQAILNISKTLMYH